MREPVAVQVSMRFPLPALLQARACDIVGAKAITRAMHSANHTAQGRCNDVARWCMAMAAFNR